MSFRRSLSSLVFLFSIVAAHFAQTVDENAARKAAEDARLKKERQNALIEQALGDADNLKLGENRALVYAQIGALLWKSDQKRALSLFRSAVDELVNAQTIAETDKKSAGYTHDLLTGQAARPQILRTIAGCDAELALEYLYKSRPAMISKALTSLAVKATKINNNSNNYEYVAQNETNLEQNFVRLAADQNPERAAKLLKDSIKKGFSGETLSLLKKLHEKDPTTANEMLAEVVGKLSNVKYDQLNSTAYQNIHLATMLLDEHTRQKSAEEKTLRFDDAQMRGLTEKLVAAAMQQSERNGYHNLHSIVPIAEKLAPASVERLKQMQKNGIRRGRNLELDPELTNLLNGEASAEQMLSEAKKFPINQRQQIYQMAAGKMAQAGDISRATQVLNDNFEDDALEQALSQLNSQHSYNLVSAEKFSEAEQSIELLPENMRLGAFINLANAVYEKNPTENKTHAVAVLGKARALVAERPEDAQEMSNLMQLINAYVAVEADEAFRLYEPLIPQMNALSDAAVVINGFQRNSNIRHGEFILTNGGSFGFYGADFSIFNRLAAHDFERTLNLIDNFTRRETRVSLKLQLAQNLAN